MSVQGAFREEYAEAFLAYLKEPGEVGLQAAYLLGRRAVQVGISVLELADAHHEVLIEELAAPAASHDPATLAASARAFLAETLSTFDMASRGFREASETARLEQRHARRLRLLAEAFLELNGSLGVDEILRVVVTRALGILDVASARCRIEIGDDEDDGATHVAETVEGDPTSVDEGLARRAAAELSPVRGASEAGALLVAPVLRGGRPVGVIQLGGPSGGSFTEQDEAILVQVAAMTAVAVENALRFEHEHQVAATLQRSLLPERVDQVAGTEIAVRYIAGGQGVEVGGDFYDVVQLGPTRVALALGDVMGKGIPAAATMGQLRMALRAYASDGRPPATVVAGLDRLMASLRGGGFATMVYLDIDLHRGLGRMVIAGHPPPVLRGADGSCGFLDGPVSPPVGLIGGPPEEVAIEVPAGSLVLLYSDGLIEGRSLSISKGLEVLLEAVASAPVHPEGVCDHVLAAMQDLTGRDDTALLACRSTAGGDVTATPPG